MNVPDDAKPSDDVIRHLVEWADGRPEVQAMLLTSTRAIPHASIDAWSDYDVILVVADRHPLEMDRTWLNEFGEVLVDYWDPIGPHADTGGPCRPGAPISRFGPTRQPITRSSTTS
ncbi:MAG: aminoglycoside 6-adenylyltransferase [Chloroflexia bacterium]|nr:aminoglycoside 6-adenylyltransferase [Chloroflexia bacterium]